METHLEFDHCDLLDFDTTGNLIDFDWEQITTPFEAQPYYFNNNSWTTNPTASGIRISPDLETSVLIFSSDGSWPDFDVTPMNYEILPLSANENFDQPFSNESRSNLDTATSYPPLQSSSDYNMEQSQTWPEGDSSRGSLPSPDEVADNPLLSVLLPYGHSLVTETSPLPSDSPRSDIPPSTSSTPTSVTSTSPTSGSSSPTYQCQFCPRQFPKKHLRNRHEEQHTKPIACPIPSCDHRTAKSRDMKRHILAHHRTAPIAQPLLASNRHVCPVLRCKYSTTGFTRKDHLVRHVKQVHPRLIP